MSSDQDWFVYIIETEQSTFYTGITTDVERRWQEHLGRNKSAAKLGSKYLKAKKPKRMVYLEIAANRSEASKRESEIKKLTRPKKDSLVDSSDNKIEVLQKDLALDLSVK